MLDVEALGRTSARAVCPVPRARPDYLGAVPGCPCMLVRPPTRRDTAVAVARMARPDQLALVIVVFATGVAAGTARGGQPEAGLALATVSLVLVAVSVHLVNEYADAGTDALTRRTRFSGGSGALAELGVPRRTALVAASAFALAGLAVAASATALEVLAPSAALLLVTGLVGGWLYSVGPFAFSRHGWGEVANAVLGGLVLPVYGVAAVSGPASSAATLAEVAVFVPFALLVLVNLLETQWPDRLADRRVGKHTLTSRLSAAQVRRLAAVAVVAAYATALVLAPSPMPALVTAASFAALPLSLWGLARLTRTSTPLPGVLAMVVMIVAQGLAWTLAGTLAGILGWTLGWASHG